MRGLRRVGVTTPQRQPWRFGHRWITQVRDHAGQRADAAAPVGGESLTRLVEELLRPGAIEMAAQPIVSLADGSVLGYEMLARTSIPCSSGPDQWLEHASYLGVRTELELACLQAVGDRGAPPGDVRLFVNLSASTFLDPRVDAVLSQLPPRVIEITEHEPVPDYQELRRRLQMWSAASTMLAIDDVGAGYSSMSHVLQLHPQFIKIDRSLVHKAHRDPNKLAVLRGLVGFARQGGITSLAEGVETSEELNALRAVGIDLVQGYLLARPGNGWPQPRRWRTAGDRSAGAAGPVGHVGGIPRRAGREDARPDRRRRRGHGLPERELRIPAECLCRARRGPALPLGPGAVAGARRYRGRRGPHRLGLRCRRADPGAGRVEGSPLPRSGARRRG